MARVLIIYGTTYGQTQRIADEMARVLRGSEHEVSLVRGDQLPAGMTIEQYDGVMVASSVLFGRHQRYIERLVRDRVDGLNAVPSAFVSVCGAMAGATPKADGAARAYRERFLDATGWHPTVARSFAGGLPYTRYRPWVRWMMKLISRRTGRPTDTSRDYDFTDWDAVRQFSRQFGGLLSTGRGALPGGTPVAAGARKFDLDELC
jgi:menaquinone-dependent protoporphyrinogen oxidase